MYEPLEYDYYYFQLVFCAKNVAYEVICDYMQYAIFGSNPILSRVTFILYIYDIQTHVPRWFESSKVILCLRQSYLPKITVMA